ncbi:MAG: hypothetical protein V4726_17020 [Verrucomicrobiota bacterium]
MKPFRTSRRLRSCLWGAAGFVVAFSLCLALKPTPSAVPSSPRTKSTPGKRPGMAEVRATLLAASSEFTRKGELSAVTTLALAEDAGSLAETELESLLDSMGREKADAPLRRILLLRWAYRNPVSVMTWLAKSDAGNWMAGGHGDEVIRVCAATDPAKLVAWYAAHYAGDPKVSVYGSSIATQLSEVNPLEAAKFCEAYRRDSGIAGPGSAAWKMDIYMQSVDNPQPLVEQAMAKLAPLTSLKSNGQRDLRKAEQHFQGWEDLFQSAATRWHDARPAAFEAWVQTQPEEFRQDTEMLMAVRSGAYYRDQISAQNSHPPALPTAFSPEDYTAIPSTESARAVRQHWSAWWKKDPAAAETFLRKSVWPEDLKFRARAAAYSTSP